MVNLRLAEKRITLTGKVLDLGGRALSFEHGKPRGASYHRFLKFENAEILRLDIDSETSPDYNIDLEKDPLPFKENSVDTVLAFNLFEHIYNHKFLIKEISRVLKPGALMLGSVPFLVRIHPDPKDFFRYSKDTLERLFSEADFGKIIVEYVGLGPFVCQYSQIEFICPRIIRPILASISILLDKAFLRLKPHLAGKFPINFIFIVKK